MDKKAIKELSEKVKVLESKENEIYS